VLPQNLFTYFTTYFEYKNSGKTAERMEMKMKLGRHVVVGHCQIAIAWNPSAPRPNPTSHTIPFREPYLRLLGFLLIFAIHQTIQAERSG